MATTKLQLNDLAHFQGVFSWDEDMLITNIRAEKPDYKQSDPATWPRMTIARFEAQLGPLASVHDSLEGLPLGLAYDDEIARAFGAEVHANIDVDRSRRRVPFFFHSFRHFPFPSYYGPGGRTYPGTLGEGLAPSTRSQWILGVAGLQPQRTTVVAPETSPPRKRRIYSISSGDSETDDAANSPARPTTAPPSATQAYREVLDVVDKLPTSKLTSLQKQINELERALVTQRDATRNVCAVFERETRIRKDRIAALEQALADKEVELESRDGEIGRRDVELKRKAAELESRDAELKHRNTSTSEAKQQVLDTWAAMKAFSHPGHQLKANNTVSGVVIRKSEAGKAL